MHLLLIKKFSKYKVESALNKVNYWSEIDNKIVKTKYIEFHLTHKYFDPDPENFTKIIGKII